MKNSKIKNSLSILLTLLMVFGMMPLGLFAASAETAADTSWYTDHESDTSYELNDTADLEGLAKLVNDGTATFEGKTVKLADDFDGSTPLTTVIGSTNIRFFKGTFDGNNKTVALSMKITKVINTNSYSGLFGYYDTESSETSIKNVKVTGSIEFAIETSPSNSILLYAGGIVGYLSRGKVDNCQSDVNITSTANNSSYTYNYYFGSVIGKGVSCTLNNLGSSGTITFFATSGTSYVGGLFGEIGVLLNVKSFVSNCFSTTSITDTSNTYSSSYKPRIGGLIGHIPDGCTISNCYSANRTITINKTTEYKIIGGIVAEADYGSKTKNCYTTYTTLFGSSSGTTTDCFAIDSSMKVNGTPLVDALNTYATSTDGVTAGCKTWWIVKNLNNGYPVFSNYESDTSWYTDHESDTSYELNDTADLEGLAKLEMTVQQLLKAKQLSSPMTLTEAHH